MKYVFEPCKGQHSTPTRIYNLPSIFKAMQIYNNTGREFCEFGFKWAHMLANYFNDKSAQFVNYPAVIWNGRTSMKGTLTVKRNGDFTFIPV